MSGTWEELHIFILKELEQLNDRMTTIDALLANIQVEKATFTTKTNLTVESLKEDLCATKDSLEELTQTYLEGAGYRERVSTVETNVKDIRKALKKQDRSMTRYGLVYKISLTVLTAALIALVSTQIRSCVPDHSGRSVDKTSMSSENK